ncbi:hypothetical protein COU57_02900 [Candidatus Pacearchaeota archaeon CG10_big_fil_rev_8_21_14_0_10_32_14]|nr:MAG: hypothetical protein COU57_02900 [Candidatus Pacearchaeota archaeon CG10_big_fil_rev_8_21_14_0_10_32_14]
MKKIMFTLLIGMLFIAFAGNVSANGEKVGYIAVNSNLLSSSEVVIRSTLISEGYVVTIIDDAQSFNPDIYDLIIVGEGVRDVSGNVDTKNKKVLFISSLAAQKAGLAVSQGKSSTANTIKINNIANEITSGYTLGTLTVYNSRKEVYYLKTCFPAGAQNLALKSSSLSESVILAVDKGAMLINGSCTRRDIKINERNLFFGLSRADSWNSDARNLFLKSVEWTIDGRINNQPVLDEDIPTLEWQKNTNLTIDLSQYFSDPDGDDLDYDIAQTSNNNGISLVINKQTGMVTFSTIPDYVGEDWIIFKAIDEGNLEVLSNQVTLKVTEIPTPPNTAPIILNEEDLNIELDEDFTPTTFDLTSFESDGEDTGANLVWSVKDKVGNFNVEVTDVTNDVLTFTSIPDATCLSGCGFTLELKDSGNLKDEAHFDVVINPSNAPNLDDIPDITVLSGAFVKVTPSATDPDTPIENLTFAYTYPLNETGEWQVPSNTVGTFTSIVRVTDPEGNFDEEEVKIDVLDGNTPVLSIGNKVIRENEELTFEVSATDPTNDTMNLSATNLPIGATFEDNTGGVGTFSWKPTFNQSGNYQVTFNVKDINNYESSKTITINVLNVEAPPVFSDAKLCTQISDMLDVQIKEPDNNDDISIKNAINVEVDLRNKLDTKQNVDVKAHLYNRDDDESVDDVSDSLNIEKKRKETSKMTLKIPTDADTDSKWVVLVIANGEDKDNVEYCNYEYLSINLEREAHDVMITEVEAMQSIASPGEKVEFGVRVENVGEEDEDVTLEVVNSDLKVNIKGEEFEVESYGNDDSANEKISIDIPENIESGTYDLRFRVYFDDGDSYDEETYQLVVTSSENKNDNDNSDNGNIFINLGKETISLMKETIGLTSYESGDKIPVGTEEGTEKIRLEKNAPKADTIKVIKSYPSSQAVKNSSSWQWKFDDETKNQVMIIIDITLALGIVIVAVGIVMYRRRFFD